jgi:hypothetical protein
MLVDKLDGPGWPFSHRWDARFVQGAKRHLRNVIARTLVSNRWRLSLMTEESR